MPERLELHIYETCVCGWIQHPSTAERSSASRRLFLFFVLVAGLKELSISCTCRGYFCPSQEEWKGFMNDRVSPSGDFFHAADKKGMSPIAPSNGAAACLAAR